MHPLVQRSRRALLSGAGLAAAFVAVLRGVAPDASADPAPPIRDVARAVRAQVPAPGVRAYLGVVVDPSGDGVRVRRVVPGSPADRAGVRADDVLLSMDGATLRGGGDFDAALAARRPGATVPVRIARDGAETVLEPQLAARHTDSGYFRAGVFRLAVVPLTFSDDPAPPASDALRALLLDRTGRRGAGASLADYYRDQSHGRLSVEGEVLAPVALGVPRDTFARRPMGGGPGSLYQTAADALALRHGDAALAAFDGIAFVHAGAAETRSGFALWPHRATVAAGGRKVPYYVHAGPGAGGGAASIGIHCHEFGHLLGLADSYGAGHRTGPGDFCLMAIGHRGGGTTGEASPFSLCAPCRMHLGWTDAAVVDARTPQRIRLRPAHTGPGETVVVALDPGCAEYLVLEVRARRGFDEDLPSEGLLVWHAGGRPTPGQSVYAQPVDLVEAHGIDVFDAALVRPGEIAFPTARCRDLTPETQPSIPTAHGAFRLDLTDVVREAGGSVVVTLGVRRTVRQAAPDAWPPESPGADGCVVRRDPVTGEDVRFWVGPAGRPGAPGPDASGRR